MSNQMKMGKTKIKIGGATCNLEDMPPPFADAIKNKLREDELKEDHEDHQKTNHGNIDDKKKISLFRKCFGYKSGILERFVRKDNKKENKKNKK